jgi:glycosyltransferase 2 family protein
MNSEKKPRNRIVIVISFAIAGALLYLALRNLDWASFWDILKNGNYKIVLLLLPIGSFNYFLRAMRWRILVQSEGNIPALSVFWANMVGYLGNAYLPARAGELLRSAFLGKQSGTGTSFVLATALTERILDAMALVLIGSAALVIQSDVSGPVSTAVRTMAIAASVGLLVIFLAPFFEDHLIRLLCAFPIPSSLREKSVQQFQRFLVGMRSLQSFRRFFLFILFTAAIWLIDGVGTMVGARIIGQSLNLGQALIYLSALGLSSAIPSTPGYVGVYQFVAVTVLVPFGFTKPDALAYILIGQILGYLVVTFWGLIGLTQIKTAASDNV